MNGFETLFSLAGDLLSFLTRGTGYGIIMWFLAFVFLWSGVIKLRQPVLAAMAIVDFGVVRQVRPFLGGLLGAVEVTLALALAFRGWPQAALLLAALLLWTFTLLIARSLWMQEDFACFCFGDTDAAISRWTLMRTVALALLATLVVFPSPSSNLALGLQPDNLLQAVVALSLLGIIVLVSFIPRLREWGRHTPPERANNNSLTLEVRG